MHTALNVADRAVEKKDNCRTSFEYRFLLQGKRPLLPAIVQLGAPTVHVTDYKSRGIKDKIEIKISQSDGLLLPDGTRADFPFTDTDSVMVVVSKQAYDEGIGALVTATESQVANAVATEPATFELDPATGASTFAKAVDDARAALVEALLAPAPLTIAVSSSYSKRESTSTKMLAVELDVSEANAGQVLQLQQGDQAYVFVVHKNNLVASAPALITIDAVGDNALERMEEESLALGAEPLVTDELTEELSDEMKRAREDEARMNDDIDVISHGASHAEDGVELVLEAGDAALAEECNLADDARASATALHGDNVCIDLEKDLGKDLESEDEITEEAFLRTLQSVGAAIPDLDEDVKQVIAQKRDALNELTQKVQKAPAHDELQLGGESIGQGLERTSTARRRQERLLRVLGALERSMDSAPDGKGRR